MNNVVNEAKTIIAKLSETEGPLRALPEVPTAAYTTSFAMSKSKQLNDVDYMWRPTILGVVPWYFFAAMCERDANGVSALPWHAFQNAHGSWQHHPAFQVLKSQHFPSHVLVDSEGRPFLHKKPQTAPLYHCRIIRH